MIYITGDTHGRHDFVKLLYFADAHPELTKKDYVIIAGDFGGVWSERGLETTLSMYAHLPFTTLFVDGNHENFDMLGSYPVEIWNGGKVHKISQDIIHLMRGQVFEIEGKTFFTFGGATSIDKYLRIEGISWWPRNYPPMKNSTRALPILSGTTIRSTISSHIPAMKRHSGIRRSASGVSKWRHSPKIGCCLFSKTQSITGIGILDTITWTGT